MKFSPKRKLPAQQLSWAQIWINTFDSWIYAESMPYGYCVYLYIDDE